MRFRKRPIEVQAVQWTGKNLDDITELFHFHAWTRSYDGSLIIPTLEGDHTAKVGDWIVRGIKGEIYPVRPDIFEETYDEMSIFEPRDES